MSGVDIGFDVDQAVALLRKSLDDRIAGLRSDCERLEASLRLAASARAEQEPIELRADVGQKRIVVVEFEGRRRLEHIELSSWGDRLGEAPLLRPTEEGKAYRAFIVIVER